MQLADLFASSLVGQAGEVAIEHERLTAGRRRSVSASFMRAATGWRMRSPRGLEAGDRVGVYLSNRVEFVDLLLVPSSTRARADQYPVSGARDCPYSRRRAAADRRDHGREAFLMFEAANPVDAIEFTGKRLPSPAGGDVPVRSTVTRRPRSSTHRARRGAPGALVLSHNNCLANTVNLPGAGGSLRTIAISPCCRCSTSTASANGLMTWLASGCRMRLVERLRRGARRRLVHDVSADAFRRAHHLRAAARASPSSHS